MQKILWRRRDGVKVKDNDKMPGTLGKKKKKRLQKPNWRQGVDLATYTQNHIDVAVRNRTGSLKPAPTQWEKRQIHLVTQNSIMVCRASSALSHFLLSKKLNKAKTTKETVVWWQRETVVDLTLNFQLPTRFFVLFSLADCTLGAEKRNQVSPPLLCLDWNNPSVVECMNSESSIISHFLKNLMKPYEMSVQIKARRRRSLENQNAQCTDTPYCTCTHSTFYVQVHTQKQKFISKNSTFSTILDVTRHLAWIPGYEWTMSYCHPVACCYNKSVLSC